MFKTILLGFTIMVSSSSAANIMNPMNPISPLNPLSPINIYDDNSEEQPIVLDKYEKRLILFKKVERYPNNRNKITIYDYKTNKLMIQFGCHSINNIVGKKYHVSYNVTKKYYSLSCEYFKK